MDVHGDDIALVTDLHQQLIPETWKILNFWLDSSCCIHMETKQRFVWIYGDKQASVDIYGDNTEVYKWAAKL